MDEESEQELWSIFARYDPSNSSFIQSKDLKPALREFGLQIPAEKLKKYSKGKVSFSSFREIILNFLQEDRVLESCKAVFLLFSDPTGQHINVSSLNLACIKFDPRLSPHEIDDMFQEADANCDGLITFPDFIRVLRKSNVLNQIIH